MIPANNTTLSFDLLSIHEARAFANTVISLNTSGVPYSLNNTDTKVDIIIGRGF
jgi:hypothetical protein